MKYNDNGTYEDIFVKVCDTLPIGAEVDYIGSTVPDGWEEINEVIWENSDRTQSFSETRNIPLGDTYKKVDIICARSISSINNIVTTVYNNYNNTPTNITEMIGIIDNKLLLRQCLLHNDQIDFYGGIIYNTYGTGTANDDYMIPLKIIGYK